MNTLIKHIILIFSVIVLFSACDSGRVFDQYYEIPKNGWHKDSVFNFEVPVEDSIHNHNFYIQIRNETNYPFSNVWLFVDVIYPDGEAVQDTIEVVLAEPSGKWLGKGFGGIKTRQAIYKRDVQFSIPGDLIISIRHGMREELLHGIHDVGFRVEKNIN